MTATKEVGASFIRYRCATGTIIASPEGVAVVRDSKRAMEGLEAHRFGELLQRAAVQHAYLRAGLRTDDDLESWIEEAAQ